MKLFPTDKAVSNDPDENKTEQITTRFYAMHEERISSLKKLINIPAPDECTFLWTQNSFNAFTFIPFCLSHFGKIDELYLSTYTISKRIADALILQIDKGTIDRVNVFVSESLKFRMPAVIDHLNALLQSRPQMTITYGWNHSKVTCVRCGDTYLVLEGSGNWGENAQYEQYVLINSKKIYEFRKRNFELVE